jgi:hypothetical protein
VIPHRNHHGLRIWDRKYARVISAIRRREARDATNPTPRFKREFEKK